MQVIIVVTALGLLIALIVGLLIVRGLQISQLVKDGVDIDGEVVQQWSRNPRGPAGRRYYLRYRYRDNLGVEHGYKSLVGHDYWSAHPPGSTIAITYSASKPNVSAPRFIVEQARVAMKRKQG